MFFFQLFIPEEPIPKCPRCGSDMFGGVRGGSCYLHTKYEAQNQAIQNWIESHIQQGSNVAVIEIGAGFNTPAVTRLPIEAFARELGDNGRLIRINPTEPDVYGSSRSQQSESPLCASLWSFQLAPLPRAAS
jgi:hypothetical protein